jgi:uracil-DNA glycosylase
MSKEIQSFYPDFFKLSPEWTSFFYNDEMDEILSFISSSVCSQYFPDNENVFRCFYLTPFENVNVVFVGHQPYHDGSATGLCFDIKLGHIINPFVQTIYKEIEGEGFYPTKNGNFEHLATQGVLMVNEALTVGKDGNHHSHLWDPFFKEVLKKLSMKNDIIWVVFGDENDYKNYITNQTHVVVEAPIEKDMVGSGLFKRINQLLKNVGKEKISW